MKIINRHGEEEEFDFNKIRDRIQRLCYDLDPIVDANELVTNFVSGIIPGMSTRSLDRISAETASDRKHIHPDFDTLAARILVSDLHKTTPDKFSQCMQQLPRIRAVARQFISANAERLDAMIVHERDDVFDSAAMHVLLDSYLQKDENDNVFDRPQYLYMRVAVELYMIPLTSEDHVPAEMYERMWADLEKCYFQLSTHMYTHATPTLFAACTKMPQFSSCFLLGTEDSVEGIMKNLADASIISKQAGGVGIHMSNIRGESATIKTTGGKACGLPRELKLYDIASQCWNQGGRRDGAFAIYLEPWHGDIEMFLEIGRPSDKRPEIRAPKLFYAVWMPDLFMRRAQRHEDWSLFNENTAPYLTEAYDGMHYCTRCGLLPNASEGLRDIYKKITGVGIGIDINTNVHENCTNHEISEKEPVFTRLYEYYETQGLALRTINTRVIVKAIIESQLHAGRPYICYKDNVNRMSNQKCIGTVKSSNLCAEIMEYSSNTSYATCTLASISLKAFVKTADGSPVSTNLRRIHPVTRGDAAKKSYVLPFDEKRYFDLAGLRELVRDIVRRLDTIVDINHYPVPECRGNARTYRPIGIGVQGLSDTFALLQLPYMSFEAEKLDAQITETMYAAYIEETVRLAQQKGSVSVHSPLADGIFHFTMWEDNIRNRQEELISQKAKNGNLARQMDMLIDHSKQYRRENWDELRALVNSVGGIRNTLGIALMPTASTSRVMQNNNSFEPCAGNYYTEKSKGVLEIRINTILQEQLIAMGLWNKDLIDDMMLSNGSVQNIEEIPAHIREIYKTVWEIDQYDLMWRAALRQAYVDQSQSFNVHYAVADFQALLDGMFVAWNYRLKTGVYYTRAPPALAPMLTVRRRKRKQLARPVQESQEDQGDKEDQENPEDSEPIMCRMEEGCISCSS